jgi:hypothetical protein
MAKQSPPIPVISGIDHRLHGHRAHGRVDRIAAGAQHVERRQRRLRVGGRHHAAVGDAQRAAGLLEIALRHRSDYPLRPTIGRTRSLLRSADRATALP